ncbi:Annexin protein [Dioscorea alata]|uniref:Annexin protein n=1 Tax=Dioscorea alata TaxID=55571 RepID=A0ACB7VR66_DIOAL|nr:Annexin protein [Dioscorea alata]
MAVSLPDEELEVLSHAFSGCGGLGVDENSLVDILKKWKQPEQRSLFRKSSSKFFRPDGHPHHYIFERWDDALIRTLKFEFARFKELVVLWTMHPWERDARFAHYVLHKAYPFTILVELGCTRSSEELLGARRAYQALYHHSLEEDVSIHVKQDYTNLLLGIVSAYRYEGPRLSEERAKLEAKVLGEAFRNPHAVKPVENEEVIRILTTRSKLQLRATFEHYKDIYGKSIDEDVGDDLCLQETVLCLKSPPTYFSKVINEALKDDVSKSTKEALTRVIVTRADVDMKDIKDEYQRLYGVELENMISKGTHGNYRDALLSLVARQE